MLFLLIYKYKLSLLFIIGSFKIAVTLYYYAPITKTRCINIYVHSRKHVDLFKFCAII